MGYAIFLQKWVGKIAENLHASDFYANKSFGKMATDIVQFNVADEIVQLASVMDLYNRPIIARSISK